MSEELINKIIIYNFHEFGDEFGNALVGLQQENQQLKECIKTDSDKIHYWVDKCEKQEKVLDEIRECLNEPWMAAEYIIQQQINEKRRELLQILDKVKE